MVKCEATTSPICFYYTNVKERFPECTRGASINISGLNLCRQHAAVIALEKLIHQGDAIVLRKTMTCKTFDAYSKKIR